MVKRVVPEGKTMCSLCSRLRRGTLYTFAEPKASPRSRSATTATTWSRRSSSTCSSTASSTAMPPKLLTDDGRNVVIRPLAYVREDDIAAYAAMKQFPIIPCNLCGSQENLQRKQVRRMLDAVGARHARPHRADRAGARRHVAVATERSETVRFPVAGTGRHRARGCARVAGGRIARRSPITCETVTPSTPRSNRRSGADRYAGFKTASQSPATAPRHRQSSPRFIPFAPFASISGYSMFFRNLTLFRFPTTLDLSQLDSLSPKPRSSRSAHWNSPRAVSSRRSVPLRRPIRATKSSRTASATPSG